jgi:LysM repeat protein
VERVAAQAGKAAPAVAIAGALVAIPTAGHAFSASASTNTVTTQGHETQAGTAAHTGAQPQDATLDSVSTHSVTVASTAKARHAARVGSTHYTVRSGDTLSTIADRYYKQADDWGYLYHENAKKISDPNMIFTGERLVIPASVPADYKLADYLPKHAKTATTALAATTITAAPAASSSSSSSSNDNTSTQSSGSNIGGGSDGGTVVVQSSGGLSGTLGCSGLEQLWESAGGNSADAFMAAEIAMAESGGNQYALSPTDDYGYWQINASNGALATFDAYGNARSAIILSDDGTNWDAWTTYTSGAYAGKC